MFNDNDVYIIAEIGGNHEGDFDKAILLTNEAIEAGADSIKYQIYTGESLVNEKEDPDRVKHFNRFALSTEQYIELANICKNNGVDFCASIWNEEQIDIFDPYMKYYKIGSGDLTAYPIIKKIAEKNKPIIISTGLSTYKEIDEVIDYIRRINSIYENDDMLCILQCTSMYPIPDDEANLKVITKLIEKYKYPIGYSDHTTSSIAAELAVTLGAKVLELHFTSELIKSDFRDHEVSFNKNQLSILRTKIELIKDLLGDGDKKPMKSEIENGHVTSFRRALYPNKTINEGDVITEEDLIALRPANGIPANMANSIIGKRANKILEKLEKLDSSMFS